MTTRRMLLGLAAAGLFTATPAMGQATFGAGVAALAYNAQHRLQYQGKVSELTGLWFGGEARARLGPVYLELRGLTGKLGGTTTTTTPELTVRVTSAGVGAAATDWLQIGVAMDAWRFESGGLATIWKLLGPAVRATPSFGIPGLRGIVDVRYFVSATASGDQKMDLAMQAQVGVEYTVPRSGVALGVGYRVGRYDFTQSGTAPLRLEQVAGLVASVGYKLGQ